jgi:hypothetical protein
MPLTAPRRRTVFRARAPGVSATTQAAADQTRTMTVIIVAASVTLTLSFYSAALHLAVRERPWAARPA